MDAPAPPHGQRRQRPSLRKEVRDIARPKNSSLWICCSVDAQPTPELPPLDAGARDGMLRPHAIPKAPLSLLYKVERGPISHSYLIVGTRCELNHRRPACLPQV
jgi:hypothetical protein